MKYWRLVGAWKRVLLFGLLVLCWSAKFSFRILLDSVRLLVGGMVHLCLLSTFHSRECEQIVGFFSGSR